MIKRIALHTHLEDIKHYFNVNEIEQSHEAKFNISPTQTLTVIINDRQNRKVIDQARWGMFPYWAPNSINTSTTSILHKDYLNHIAKRNRCIIPCTGFYGQKQFREEKEIRAMHIVNPGQTMFGIAGIYDTIEGPNRQEIKLVTILTEEMSGPLSSWQASSPVIVHENSVDAWLDRSNRQVESLLSSLVTLDSYNLKSYPVTNAIHNDNFESPDCVKEVSVGFKYIVD